MTVPTQHPFDFDPTYDMTLKQLLAVRPPPEPDGFATFWQARHVRALGVDPKPSLQNSAASHADWQVSDIVYTSTDCFQIGGWLLVPKSGKVRRGLVVGHGYGGRDQPDFDIPVEETAILFPCFRGLSRSARAPISQSPAWHVLDHIDKPDAYIVGGCVDDLWLGVSALIALFPGIAGRIGYSGISFGGGIGALAIPFDGRIDRGYLEVPTFGHRPLWLSLPTTGSAAAVQAYQRRHPGILENLRLFDAATAASRIAAPMLVAAALFDPAVAPPCQFAIANALTRFNENFILDAGHFDYAGAAAQRAALLQKIETFFGAP
jgi:cephalosporin-C deacetylase